MTTYTKVYTPPVDKDDTPDGHKVFVGEDGKVYLADGSGSTPSDTDDGPLRVSNHHTGPGSENLIVIGLQGNRLNAVIPVYCERDQRDAVVHTTYATAKAVMKHIPDGIGIGYSDAVFKLLQQVEDLKSLARVLS